MRVAFGGLLTIESQVLPNRTETKYDALGRVSEEWTGIAQVVDAQGQTLLIDYSQMVKTRSIYDAFGNVVETQAKDGTGTLLADSGATFDDLGRKTSDWQWVDDTATSQVRSTKTYHYDAEGRLTATILPAVSFNNQLVAPEYSYAYSALGQQYLLRDAMGHETRWTFDDQGRTLTRTLPLGFGEPGASATGVPVNGDWTESFAYDDHGRQTLATSFEGVVTQSVYDNVTGRLTEQRFFDNAQQFDNGQGTPSQTVVSQYDAFGRRVAAIRHAGNANGEILRDERWVYDQQGNLTAQITPEGVIGYGYDTLGRQIRTVTAAAPSSVNDREALASALSLASNLSPLASLLSDTRQTYDSLGRLATVTVWTQNGLNLDPAQRLTTKYSYDLQGRLSRVNLPNRVIEATERDALGVLQGRMAELFIAQKYTMWRNGAANIWGKIPDFIGLRVIREVKNKLKVAWDGQLPTFAQQALDTGKTFYLHVREDTYVLPSVYTELNKLRARGLVYEIVRDVPDWLKLL